MDNDYWEIRDRNWGVLSKKEQHTLKGSSAIVIGLGCVGELEAVMLARIGIGNLTIVDFDTLKKVNLNRNPFSTQSLLNRKKTKNIQELIADIDPTIKTTVINKEITFGCEDLLNKGDVILQAVDDMKSRIIIHRMVENTLNIPIVTMSGGPPNRSFVAVFDHKTDILYEDFLKLKELYLASLYKYNQPTMFKDKFGTIFLGKIVDVFEDGRLIIELENKTIRKFNLKEVKFANR